jgi:hypothetical protein
MSLLTITINDPGLKTKSAEIAFARRALATVETELGRANGNTTSGSIVGQSATGVPNTSLGSWTYTPSATQP